jgi:hypothetical protein
MFVSSVTTPGGLVGKYHRFEETYTIHFSPQKFARLYNPENQHDTIKMLGIEVDIVRFQVLKAASMNITAFGI